APNAPRGKRLHSALIGLRTIAYMQRAREYGDDSIVRVKMWLVSKIRRKPRAIYVHSSRLVVTSKVGSVNASGHENPFELVRRQSGRLQRLALGKRRRHD